MSILRLVVPHSMKHKIILKLAHDRRIGRHWGRDKKYAKVRHNFFWSSMRRDCRLFVETCSVCHLNKGGRAQRVQLLHQAGVPGERIHLDLLGPFTTSDSGNKYILMMVDQFSRCLELYALPEQTAVITANIFFEQWIA